MNPQTQEKLMKFGIIGAVAGLVLGLVMPHFRSPPAIDENTRAYALILVGMKTGKYEVAKAKFDEAYSISNDSEILYLADFFSRGCQLCLDAGVQTFEEASSMEGYIKAFVTGFINPMKGLTAWSLLAKYHLGDFDKNCAIVDSRYQPTLQAYLTALQKNSRFSWSAFVATLIGFVVYGAMSEEKKPTDQSPQLKVPDAERVS